MLEKLIKSDATAELKGNYLAIRGTDAEEIGDILADALVWVPKKTLFGYVSLSVYLQAETIFEEYKEDIHKLDYVYLDGHSLGAGICCIMALLLIMDNYQGKIHIIGKGGLKSISKKVAERIAPYISSVEWRVNHKDIVPFLGFWSEPLHDTEREGDERQHPFDWDFSTHMSYWNK